MNKYLSVFIWAVISSACLAGAAAEGYDGQGIMNDKAVLIVESDQPVRQVFNINRGDGSLFLTKPDREAEALADINGRHPALGRTSTGALLAGYEVMVSNNKMVRWVYSLNEGQTWGGSIIFNVAGATYPTVDYYGAGTTFYGSFVTPAGFLSGAGVILLRFGSLTDSTTWVPYWTDFSDDSWHHMTDCDIAADNSQQSWNWGLISLVMSYTDATSNVVNAPHIYSQISSSGLVQLSWFPNKPNCNITSTVIDPVADKTYAVYDRLNATTQQWELFVRQDRFSDWFQPTNSITLTFQSARDAKYPSVAAYGDTIVIVAESYTESKAESGDIVCWSSFNGQLSGLIYRGVVGPTIDVETNPKIAHVGGNDFVCTYKKEGDRLARVTCDGGLTWSDRIRISPVDQNVVGGRGTSNITGDGQRLAWEYASGGDTLFTIGRLGNLDLDDDGLSGCVDNCPLAYNPDQIDADADGVGDACDACPGYDDKIDPERDAVPTGCDNCPATFNPDQADADGDAAGDVCDACTDTDQDGFRNAGYPGTGCPLDNCPTDYNPGQEDGDGDGVGNLCDNCLTIPNSSQSDFDQDGIGDVCDECTDSDEDGFGNPGYPANTCLPDNCPNNYNPDQADADLDGIGDICDFLCGDANRDENVNVGDAVFLINYVFKSGSPPDPVPAGDANCDHNTDVGDAVYIVNYTFKGGASPCCP